MFGFGGPCGFFDSAGYSSIKFRYEAAQARADSLWAAYTSAYNNYKAKYDEYKRLYDRQAAAQNELNETGAELANVNGALGAAEAHLAASHETKGQLQNLEITLARWDSTNVKLQQLASRKLTRNWESQFERMARLAGIAQMHRLSLLGTFVAFRGLTTDLPDPPVSTPPEDQTETEAPDPASSEPTSEEASTRWSPYRASRSMLGPVLLQPCLLAGGKVDLQALLVPLCTLNGNGRVYCRIDTQVVGSQGQ